MSTFEDFIVLQENYYDDGNATTSMDIKCFQCEVTVLNIVTNITSNISCGKFNNLNHGEKWSNTATENIIARKGVVKPTSDKNRIVYS